MALLSVQYNSKALELCTTFQAVLPDEGELSRAKVVYLLHGLSDNNTGWTRYTSCERYARERGLALIIPEVQRSFYMNQAYGLDYYTYISRELPEAVHRLFGLRREREFNYICGLSMGGYGALKCALNNPGQYAGCGSFSGVADVAERFRWVTDPRQLRELTGLLGPERRVSEENDVMHLAKTAEALPDIYLSCGEQDDLYPMNRELAGVLAARGSTYRFDHRPGKHSWDFWDQSLQDCFAYFFGGKP